MPPALTDLERSLADAWIAGPRGLQGAYFYASGVTEAYRDDLGTETVDGLNGILGQFNTLCEAAKNVFVIGWSTAILLLSN